MSDFFHGIHWQAARTILILVLILVTLRHTRRKQTAPRESPSIASVRRANPPPVVSESPRSSALWARDLDG